MNNLSVPATGAMSLLLQEKTILRDCAKSIESIQKVFFQIAQDITTEENRDRIGPTILAIKHCSDILNLFALEGALIIEKEDRLKTKPNN